MVKYYLLSKGLLR